MTHRRRNLLIAFVLLAIVGVVLVSRVLRATPHVRNQVVAALNERFESEVALDAFHVSVFPQPEVSGSGLFVRWDAPGDVPPLVRVAEFSASAGVFGLLGTPVRLRKVQLDRLDLYVPPGGLRGVADSSPSRDGKASDRRPRLLIDEIVARAAQLQIASKTPGKSPRVFEIHNLRIFGYGEQEGADFQATLTNPTPNGSIATIGRFGPWQPREPRTTPLKGDYTFTGADMNTIKGLGGTLTSHGSFRGVLERIEVTGETDTPNFSIDVAGQPVPLTTKFNAIVDGTNGDTFLESVDGRLLESHIHAKGSVVRSERVKGHRVSLDITVDKARLEDFLKLAVKTAKPPLTGAIRVNAKLLIPPGDVDVVRKMQLDGQFSLDRATFTDFDVQKRINTLSRKGRGDDGAEGGASVVSKLQGRFALRDARLSFSSLTFAVPGAVVQLAGSYHLEREALDFTGHLLLDASLRETTSGAKAVLAVIAQPFFRRPGGGSKIPIRIGGTRDKPSFGLDVKRALLPG